MFNSMKPFTYFQKVFIYSQFCQNIHPLYPQDYFEKNPKHHILSKIYQSIASNS